MKKLMFLTMVLGIILITTSNTFAVNDQGADFFRDRDFQDGLVTYNIAGDESENLKYLVDDGWNDVISSVKVGKNVKVILYSDGNFQGRSLVLYPGEYKDFRMNFGDNPWNDTVSSVKVVKLSNPNAPLIKLTYTDGFTQMVGLDGTDEFKSDWCLLRDNDIKSADIPAEYKVTFYEHPNYEGFSNVKPVTGKVNMNEISLERKVSSLKIELKMYKLANTSEKDISPPKPLESVERLDISFECDNSKVTSGTMLCSNTLETEVTETATTIWSNATEVGLTATMTAGVEAGLPGVGTGKVETSLAVQVANNFTFGASQETKTSKKITNQVSQNIAGGAWVKFFLSVQPVERNVEVTYTYAPVDGIGPNKEIKANLKIIEVSTASANSIDVQPPKNISAAPAEESMTGRAWEWIKSSPTRLLEFFGYGNSSTTNTNTNTNTTPSVQPSNSSSNATNPLSINTTNSNPTPNSNSNSSAPNSVPVKSTADLTGSRWKRPDDAKILNFTENKMEIFLDGKTTVFATHTYRVVDQKTLALVNANGAPYYARLIFSDKDDSFRIDYLLANGSVDYAEVFIRIK